MRDYYLVSYSVRIDIPIRGQIRSFCRPEVATCIFLRWETTITGDQVSVIQKIIDLKSYLENGTGLADEELKVKTISRCWIRDSDKTGQLEY